MSMSFGCKCPQRRQPIEKRMWGVTKRHSRCSAFDGYQWEWSPYSEVMCLQCGAAGRTKANYVEDLPAIIMKGSSWAYAEDQPERKAVI